MESQQELEQLKVQKKELKQQIRMGESCIKENLRTAEYLVDSVIDEQISMDRENAEDVAITPRCLRIIRRFL